MRDGGRVTDAVIIGCCNLIADGDRYLLVKEAKASARSRYNLPAGKPEVGETLTEAAVREAREETGLTVAIKTSEGFGVVNFVFAVRPLAGTLATSPAHPDVRYFSRVEIAALAAEGMVRGTHIERAIDDHAAGGALPLSIIEVVTASSFPIVA